jgi:hypothetical protein
MHAPTAEHACNIKVTIFGHASTTAGQTVLAERLVTADELRDGRFEAALDADARAKGWEVTHLSRRTPEDQAAYEELLQLAAEYAIGKAKPHERALLERFLTGEVTEDLLLALGRTVGERAGHPVADFALKAAERDVYRVFWRTRLAPLGIHALLH